MIDKKDPFGISDYKLEQESGKEYTRIRTLAVERILRSARRETNIIFKGPKGAGKSTAMAEAGKILGDECFVMAGFRTLADVYNYLWLKIWNNYKDDLETLKGRFNQGDFIQLPMWFKMDRCGYKKCPRQKFSACALQTKGEDSAEELYDKRRQQKFFVKYRSFEEICKELHFKKENCPMKRSIVNMLLETRLEKFRDKVYLYDVHDELLTQKYDLIYVNVLLRIFQNLGTVVVTATIDQCKKLKTFDALARIKVNRFPLPTDDELKQIYAKRIETQKGTPNVNFLSFTDGTVELLIKLSHNVARIFIQLCSDVFMELDGRGVKLADEKFAMEALGNDVCAVDETTAIELLVRRLRKERKGWVKVREVSGMLEEVYGVEVGERRLGRRLKIEWKLGQRNNDGSEYKF